jgi:radical SAM protein with 4Fe4S-binding SPASM domain
LPQNFGDLESFETWAATIPWIDTPLAYSMFFELRSRRDSSAKNRVIQKLRMAPDRSSAFFRRHKEAYLKGMQEFCRKFMGAPGDRLFSCGSGHAPCVDAYGMLQPCLPLRHPATVYDLKAGSLREALTDFFPRLRETRATNADYLARCARCFLKSLCEQCPAKSWTEHGALDTPVEYFCQVAHVQARDLGLLKEREQAWEVENWRERMTWI